MITILRYKQYLGSGQKHEDGMANMPSIMFSYPHPNISYISRHCQKKYRLCLCECSLGMYTIYFDMM